jgi:hypothetical protein
MHLLDDFHLLILCQSLKLSQPRHLLSQISLMSESQEHFLRHSQQPSLRLTFCFIVLHPIEVRLIQRRKI